MQQNHLLPIRRTLLTCPSSTTDTLTSFARRLPKRSLKHPSFEHQISIKEGKQLPCGLIDWLTEKNLNQALQKYLDNNLARDVIDPSKSPVAEHILFVKNKDKLLCLYMDHRQLNEFIIKHWYPLPSSAAFWTNFECQARALPRLTYKVPITFCVLPRVKSGRPHAGLATVCLSIRSCPFGLAHALALFDPTPHEPQLWKHAEQVGHLLPQQPPHLQSRSVCQK